MERENASMGYGGYKLVIKYGFSPSLRQYLEEKRHCTTASFGISYK
jgi:hypothetical protein